MSRYRKAVAVVIAAVVLMVGWSMPALAQSETDAAKVNATVTVCVDPTCANTMDVFTMEGAQIESYNAAGELVDLCGVAVMPEGNVVCSITPAPEGGYYVVSPTADYAHYTLVSEAPTVWESAERGTTLQWQYAPTVDGEQVNAERILVTAFACADRDCPQGTGFEPIIGAEITSYNAADEVVDTCAVALRSDDYGSGCELLPAPADGYYDIALPAAYDGYELITPQGAIGETNAGLTAIIFTFNPPAEVAAQTPTLAPQPTKSAAAPQPTAAATGSTRVTALPSTGAGEFAGHLDVIAIVGLGALGVLVIGTRKAARI